MPATRRARNYARTRRASGAPAQSHSAAGADLNYLISTVVHTILESEPRAVSGLIVPGSFNPSDGTVEFADGDELANALEDGGPLTFPRYALASTVHGMAYAPRGLERAVRIPRGGSGIIVMEHDGGVDGNGDTIPPEAVDVPGGRPGETPLASGELVFYKRDHKGNVTGWVEHRNDAAAAGDGLGRFQAHGGGFAGLRTRGNALETEGGQGILDESGHPITTGYHRVELDETARRITVATTGGHTDIFDDAGRVISRVTSGGLIAKMDDVAKQVTHVAVGASSTLDGVLNSVSHVAGTASSKVDGAVQAITHQVGTVKTIVDGAGNTISHIVPGGGILSLGALASTLDASRAVLARADHVAMVSDLITTTLQSQMNAMATALVTAAGGAANPLAMAVAFKAAVTAAGWATGNITLPTIPLGSGRVRVAT